MTDVLVRLPDQFRPSRDTPMAATPTCCSCCCCCCCVATLITSSIVLPMRVELLARESAVTVPAGRATWSKVLAGLAPVASFVLAIVAAQTIGNLTAFLLAFVLVLFGMVSAAYAPFGQSMRALPVVLAYIGAFGVEFIVGGFGILATAGIGYAIVALLAAIGVVRMHTRRLAVGTHSPGDPGAGRRGPERPPPPLPRPPSSDE